MQPKPEVPRQEREPPERIRPEQREPPEHFPVRQEQEHMQVRYYSSKPEEGSRNCTPNLEDVFLVTYQEEPA